MVERVVWYPIPDFDEHEVSDQGEIRNKNNKRVMKPSVNQTGVRYLSMRNTTLGGYQNRALSKVVADVFCPGKSSANDTVLHRDGNINNMNPNNLLWAPRWHAIAYHNQLQDQRWHVRNRVVEGVGDTGVIYRSFADAAMATGALPSEIEYAVRYNDALSDDTHPNLIHRVTGGYVFRSAIR